MASFNAKDFRANLAILSGDQVASAKFDTGRLGGLSFGYALPHGLRIETELVYRDNDYKHVTIPSGGLLSSATDSSDVDGDEDAATAMFNVWYELFPIWRVRPYLGAGTGAARVEINKLHYDSAQWDKDSDTVFAWQVGGGLAFDLSPHWTAALNYRYLKGRRGEFDGASTDVSTTYVLTLRYVFAAPVAAPPEPAPEVVPPAEEPAPAPPPPPPACRQPTPGEPLSLDGCKAGDTLVLHGVNFEFNQSRLTLNAKTLLDQVVDELNRHPDIKVEVGGHTDAKGSDAYNDRLSAQRADAVKAYLTAQGIAAERLTTHGYGESVPVADNTTEDGRAQNRRVELKITEGGTRADVAPQP
ncbi:MAG: OmpA family protein [Solimonas sp.]